MGPSGVIYEKYSGKIYVSQQNGESKQGFNVAELQSSGELRVLGYTQRNAERTLKLAVYGVLKSYGWFDHYIESLLSE